ncbi:MAG: hypothetical protein R3C44_21220 [Chloroflexota bacterium]
MKSFPRRRWGLGATLAISAILVLSFVSLVLADTVSTDFESFSLGDVNGQNGWSKTGPYDVEIVDQSSLGLSYAGFGSRSLQFQCRNQRLIRRSHLLCFHDR